MKQVGWVLDYLPDVDADFLTFYRIDLRDPETEITAAAFFSRLFRLFHYRGAIRDRLIAEQEENERPTARDTVSVTPTQPAPQEVSRDNTRWVSPNEMQMLFPDLFKGE